MNCGELKIDIGCGPKKQESYIGIDKHDYSAKYPVGEFIQRDLEIEGLPFCDNSAIAIWASNVMEHIRNFIPLMNECWRVLKPDGEIVIEVPIWSSEAAFKDPTHVRYFSEVTFEYFQNDVRIENYGLKRWVITESARLANHADIIRVKMKPVK